jgi:hypothetical protein
MACLHEFDLSTLYPADVEVLHIGGEADDQYIGFAVACPDCGTSVEMFARVESRMEVSLAAPLDDAPDTYD